MLDVMPSIASNAVHATDTATDVAGRSTAAAALPAEGELFRMQLSADFVMWECDIDLELCEFLCTPPLVQELSYLMCVVAWRHVVDKTCDLLEMKQMERAGACPYCTVRGECADVAHVLTSGCVSKRPERITLDSLLRAMLEAARMMILPMKQMHTKKPLAARW